MTDLSVCMSLDPGHSEKLDQTVVCAEAGRPAHLQNQQERAVGRDGAAERLRAHRETLQEGRLLLQALSPAGAVHMGRQGQDSHCFRRNTFFLSLSLPMYSVS